MKTLSESILINLKDNKLSESTIYDSRNKRKVHFLRDNRRKMQVPDDVNDIIDSPRFQEIVKTIEKYGARHGKLDIENNPGKDESIGIWFHFPSSYYGEKPTSAIEVLNDLEKIGIRFKDSPDNYEHRYKGSITINKTKIELSTVVSKRTNAIDYMFINICKYFDGFYH